MSSVITDLPFKVRETLIVILKEVPVIQCNNCTEYLLEDHVMERVDVLLENADTSSELEIIRYAA
jgi:YgiT-type zinc finger domain-containing protein